MASDTTSRARRGAIALAIVLAWPCGLAAQHDQVPEPAAYALTDVSVVQADGERSDGVTIVVRGEYIEALGGGVEPPADARVLEGEGLVVYPGIVDAQGEADVEMPDPEIRWDSIRSWDPPRGVQGYSPSRRLVDFLAATGEQLDGQRRSGVVAAAVHPDGSLMPGRGTLLLFRKDARRPAELVLSPVLGPTFTLQGGRVYPGTLFGVIAFMRQRFEDARRQGDIETHFAGADGPLAGPRWDPDLAVLRDVIDGDPPVFFHADRADDVRRAIGLADTYGFRPIIVGGEEAWTAAELLRERDVPVLVSLDFPTPRRWDPDEEPDEEAADTVEVEMEEPEPLDAAALDEKQRLEEAYANAGRLEAAGVTFALTSGGGEADILEGARKAVEYGLPEAAALRALTAAPAELLGQPRLVRIAADAPATFIVADGPLFDDDTDIAYTFVEGRLEEGSTGGPQPGDEPPAVDVTGTWEVDLTVQGQDQAGTMRLTQDGASFEGDWETAEGTARVVDGVVSASDVSFTLVIDAGGQEIEASMSGSVEGDDASGSGSVSAGGENLSLSWTARRTSDTPDGARGGTR